MDILIKWDLKLKFSPRKLLSNRRYIAHIFSDLEFVNLNDLL